MSATARGAHGAVPLEIVDPLESTTSEADERPRQRYLLQDTGFDEVPKKFRRFYRKWRGEQRQHSVWMVRDKRELLARAANFRVHGRWDKN